MKNLIVALTVLTLVVLSFIFMFNNNNTDCKKYKSYNSVELLKIKKELDAKGTNYEIKVDYFKRGYTLVIK